MHRPLRMGCVGCVAMRETILGNSMQQQSLHHVPLSRCQDALRPKQPSDVNWLLGSKGNTCCHMRVGQNKFWCSARQDAPTCFYAIRVASVFPMSVNNLPVLNPAFPWEWPLRATTNYSYCLERRNSSTSTTGSVHISANLAKQT